MNATMKKNSKRLGYMDLGGAFVNTSSMYTKQEPVSGMGTISESTDWPKKGKGYNYKAHKKRSGSGPSKCYKKHNKW
jgi:hypothetical protein